MAKCEFCGAHMHQMAAPTDWEWFTGYFNRTLYFCPSCRVTRAKDVKSLLDQSLISPKPHAAWEVPAKASANAAVKALRPTQAPEKK